MKAMILAAGFGTRFLPLTKYLPKPLLPFFNKPMILHTLEWLKSNDIRQVIINLHHLGERIYQAVGDGRSLGMEISYSWEKEILGTGGGVKKAADFFQGKRFILVNSDVFVNLDIAPLMDYHQRKGSAATMFLVEDDIQRYGGIGIDQEGKIVSVPWRKNNAASYRQGVFSGLHILEPEILSYLPEGFSCINKNGYQALLERNLPVYGYFAAQAAEYPLWCDLGEVGSYLAAHWKLLKSGFPARLGYRQVSPGIWCRAKESLPDEGQFIPPVLIGHKCSIAPDCQIGPNLILGEGTKVAGSVKISSSVILPESVIPPDSEFRSRLWGNNIVYGGEISLNGV
ncbi:MAG: NDP-sugar synthase [Candidatus Schekmanbacteria bacterium]|nr:NDP-sugar synthase [Candidatus Schekmanbacteria bacterium]